MNTQKSNAQIKPTTRALFILLSSIFGVMILYAVYAYYAIHQIPTIAAPAPNDAVISIEPKISTIPPDHSYQIWITTSQKIGFIRVVIQFDTSKLLLISNPEIIIPGFTTIMSTTPTQANTSGSIVLVAGIGTANISNTPTGIIKFANVTFAAKSARQDSKAVLHIDKTESQIVYTDAIAAKLTSNDAIITKHP
jgi:hypothetical protein